MKFDKGFLGIFLVSVSICVSVLMAYGLSADSTVEDYTAYEYITEVTTLFDSTNVPKYIDYSPAANVTGYNAADVDFTDSKTTNNFPITEYGTVLHADTYEIGRP